LAERLLNDLVRTTEGFQSLKKTNEQFKELLFREEQKVLIINMKSILSIAASSS
jgi:hypothetical protein